MTGFPAEAKVVIVGLGGIWSVTAFVANVVVSLALIAVLPVLTLAGVALLLDPVTREPARLADGRLLTLAPSDIDNARDWFQRHGAAAVFFGLAPGPSQQRHQATAQGQHAKGAGRSRSAQRPGWVTGVEERSSKELSW